MSLILLYFFINTIHIYFTEGLQSCHAAIADESNVLIFSLYFSQQIHKQLPTCWQCLEMSYSVYARSLYCGKLNPPEFFYMSG